MDEAGLVVARHRRHIVVEDAAGEQHVCLTRKRSVKPLVGDRVSWQFTDGSAVVTEVLERTSTLTRMDSRGRREAIAANVDQLLIVAAAEPQPDRLLLDRYLAGAELLRMRAIVVFNKMDLLPEPPKFLDVYEAIGYPVRRVSVVTRTGLDDLEAVMRGRRSAMVGQSGVGKSSLLNALLGAGAQAVGTLSQKSGHGRHTTTTAVLYKLPGGGELIDSPGVRHYAPYIERVTDVQQGFREFRAHLGRCRFDNCLHVAEPDCAIKAAVAASEIDASRYDSYVKMCEQIRSLRSS